MTDFKTFDWTARILVHFSDDLSMSNINDLIQDWYVMYKESGYKDDHPAQYIKWHLTEVNRDTHDFWLDERGIAIMDLGSK